MEKVSKEHGEHMAREEVWSLQENLLNLLAPRDLAELDFGIYRFLSYRKRVIENFITRELPELLRKEISSLGLEGTEAEEAEKEVYRHLISFFGRYYKNGILTPKPYYGFPQRGGEDVSFHWINEDQYYVKTGEYFRNYEYLASNGVKVRFVVAKVDVEKDGVRGEKRFFFPIIDKITWEEDKREITIPFEYRPLVENEGEKYGRKNRQDEISRETVRRVQDVLSGKGDAERAVTESKGKDAQGRPKYIMETHLRKFTKVKNVDFFIHKDLKGFLSKELDFYIRNELIDLEKLLGS